jgi:hypothetical protein
VSAVLLADVRAFLNLGSGTPDAEVQDTLDRAEAILAARVGPLGPVTVTDEVHHGGGALVLRRYPVLSVTSVSVGADDFVDVDFDPESGVVYGAFLGGYRGVRVTYVAGRSPLPADLEAAVLELTAHLWRSQRGAAGPSPLAAEQDGENSTAGYLLPYRVQALIEPHLLAPALG